MDSILLVAAIGVFLVVGWAGQRVERERRRVGEREPSGAGHRLSHYELAYLAGGPRRAINTALAVLATPGAVRVSRGSQVTPVHGVRPSPEPMEQAVLDALAAGPGGCRAGELRRELERHPALTALAGGLEARGLIVPEQAYGTAWRLRDRLKWITLGAAGYLVLLIVLDNLDLAGEETAFAGALFIAAVALVTGLVALAKQDRRLHNVTTREGRAVLVAARGHHPRGVRDPASLALAVGVPVALYGLQDAGDQALCDELSAGDPGGDCAGACGTHPGGDGATYGTDSYGGGDFGGSGGDSGGGSSCGSGCGSSCGGGSG
ncbi:TIGR04222 domain-containing membrane protein [Nonomuraea maheshkhaliensis]|uniref:TIGR04222 domain-containing membrane protein n=1 Tax=Nonomuraea maheshkhaliensis TaxID=419590 RepID=A0ABN2GV77_9ACTN